MTETDERLKRVEEKLDQLIQRADQAERVVGAFLLGPGRKFAKLIGGFAKEGSDG